MAFKQISQPHPRRRRAADSALNGYKIANPTILARIPPEELENLFVGYGYRPYLVAGGDPATLHQEMASTFDRCLAEIQAIQQEARRSGVPPRPRWPMIILRTPKGWTAPKELDGHRVEGSWRAHQVPITDVVANPAHLKLLEHWMLSYRPHELFDARALSFQNCGHSLPSGTAA